MQKNYGLWIVVLLAGYLAFLLLSAYWQFLAFALLFSVLFYRPYKELAKRINPNLAAFAIVLVILILLVIPTIYVLNQAVQQVPAAYQGLVSALGKESVRDIFGMGGDEIRFTLVEIGASLRQNVVQNAAAYFNQVTTIVVGLFLMFISTFFFLRDGKKMYDYVVQTLPVHRRNTVAFIDKMHNLIDGLLIGHLVTAIVQGVLAGLVFWVLGVPNALLLSIITIVISIIPFLGPFLIYIPAAIYLFAVDRYIAAMVVLAFGVIVISQIDNAIRPYIANRTTSIHPLTVIIGVIAGIKFMGFIGFIIGPLILAGFLALFEFSMTGNEAALRKAKKHRRQ